MRTLRIGLAALSIAVIIPAAGSARPATHELVLDGSRSASVVVSLPRPVKLTCCEMRGEERDGSMHFGIEGFSAETRGSYVGFAIERISDGRIMKIAVRVPQLDLGQGLVPTVISFSRVTKLAPGRYRIHLLTDGRSTVRVAAPGLPKTTYLNPSQPSNVTAELVELTTPAGLPSLQSRVPIEVAKSSVVLLAVMTEGELTQAHYLSQCVTAPGDVCKQASQHEPWVTAGSGGGGGALMDAHVGTLPAGSYDAVFSAASVGASTASYGFVLVFDPSV